MKSRHVRSWRLAIDCVALVVIHFAMLQILARTHLMEKLMAGQFHRWELAVILIFIFLRVAVYFLVPSVLSALLVIEIFRRCDRPPGS